MKIELNESLAAWFKGSMHKKVVSLLYGVLWIFCLKQMFPLHPLELALQIGWPPIVFYLSMAIAGGVFGWTLIGDVALGRHNVKNRWVGAIAGILFGLGNLYGPVLWEQLLQPLSMATLFLCSLVGGFVGGLFYPLVMFFLQPAEETVELPWDTKQEIPTDSMTGTQAFFRAFLGTLKGSTTLPDPAFDDETLLALRQALGSGNFAVVQQHFDSLTDNNLREYCLSTIVLGGNPNPDFFDEWAKTDRVLPLLVRGLKYANEAWQTRGGDYASEVSPADMEIFQQGLALARRDFERAAELAPADPLPYAYLIPAHMGGDDPEAALVCFQEAISRDPQLQAAYYSTLAYLVPRWHGDQETLFQFARDHATDARPGDFRHGLIVHAHLEMALEASWEKETSLTLGFIEYFSSPVVQKELLEAFDLFDRDRAPARTALAVQDLNVFALAFGSCYRKNLAKRIFHEIGDRITTMPWMHFPNWHSGYWWSVWAAHTWTWL